jgi:serine/threonine protein kinase
MRVPRANGRDALPAIITVNVTLPAGTRLGPYEIVVPIGAGGMGEVYRARDTRLSRDVALKLLPASLVHDPSRLQRFEQEARATSALNHPNILTVHDIGTSAESGGTPFIVSELLDGVDLRRALADGPLSTHDALDYAVQIAGAPWAPRTRKGSCIAI